ncbi:polysaccharide biosynthesis tyrosine autokinase [bacterium]|nr:polysaccharide biosynthesis tyrosine autokinase [bacterium]
MQNNQSWEEEVSFKDYLRVILKRKWTVFNFFIILVTIVAIGSFKMKPVYEATTRLLIEKERSSSISFQEIVGVETSQEDYYQTQYKIIKSRRFAREVVKKLHLERISGFTAGTKKDTVTLFLKYVKVNPIRNSRLVDISVEYGDPQLAAEMVNTLADVYIQQNLESSIFIARGILAKLPEEERSYEKIEDLAINTEKLSSLPSVINNPLIQQLKMDHAEVEAKYANLSKRYKKKHPTMIELTSTLERMEDRINWETKRVVESLKTELSGALRGNNIRIIDKAEIPDIPIKPKVKLNIILAIMAGLMGGCGLVFLFEYLDDTVKGDRDIEQYLGLVFLGFIPKINNNKRKDKNVRDKDLFVNVHSESIISELIKSIRSKLIFSLPKDKLKTILVTSTGPQEGKTFTAVNLAAAFAQLGEKTLLVDCDLRRPSVHKIFTLKNGKGVSDYLVGEAELDEIIKETEVKNLSVIFSGAFAPNPAELLNPQNLEQFMQLLKTKFDRVILDSPPIIPVSDVLGLSTVVDGVIQVVCWGKVSRQVIKRATKILREVNARILGAVLNNIDVEKSEYSYYSDQYK